MFARRILLLQRQTPRFLYSKFDASGLGDLDTGSVLEAVKAPSEVLATDMLTKISSIMPGRLYDQLDLASRDLLMYLADDLNWGMGASILAISVGLKLFFGPMMFSAQINGIKMKLIEPETKNFQALIQRYARAQDFTNQRLSQKQYSQFRRKHNISMLIPALSIIQVPFLMTWFFSLRYVTSLPETYVGLKTQGFLWFHDLAAYDPYGILPMASAFATFMNISLNPNMQSSQSAPFAKYYRYMRFLPFFSIPIVVFFPAGINLYWCSSAIVHLIISQLARAQWVRRLLGIPDYLPGTILERMHQSKNQTVIKAVIEEQPNQLRVEGQATAIASSDSIKVFKSKPKKK